jgi:hypothetical protein
MLQAGLQRKVICEQIGIDKSVISRALRKSSDKRSGKYRNKLTDFTIETLIFILLIRIDLVKEDLMKMQIVCLYNISLKNRF